MLVMITIWICRGKIKMDIEKLKELQIAMITLEDKQLQLRARKTQFDRENEELVETIKSCNEAVEERKESLRLVAIEEYNQDKVKKRFGGLGIRVLSTIDYDETVALKWAKEKDMFLKLDKPNFDKVAKQGCIDFVEILEETTVTFPKEIKLE